MDSLILTNVLLMLILAYLIFTFDRDTFNLLFMIVCACAVLAIIVLAVFLAR